MLADIQKRQISKIGIVIDIDLHSTQERLQFINKCLRQVFTLNNEFSDISQFITVNIPGYDSIEIACYFTHVEGQGELETVLKLIKTKESTYADCLESWRNCLESNNKLIKDKDYDKFWISNYLRFDTCFGDDKKQAERKCSMKNFEYIMENKKISGILITLFSMRSKNFCTFSLLRVDQNVKLIILRLINVVVILCKYGWT